MKTCTSCNEIHHRCKEHNAKGEPCGRRPKKGKRICAHCSTDKGSKARKNGSTILQHLRKSSVWNVPEIETEKPDNFDKISAKFYKAWEATCGNISASCEYAGIDRKTYYNWMKSKKPEHVYFRNQLKDLRPAERKKDLLEATLLNEALKGNTTALIYQMKTQARDRGYGDRPMSEMISDKEKAEMTIVQIEKRSVVNGVTFQEELECFLGLYEDRLKPEILGLLRAELD